VETGHCAEVGGERLALALLKLLDQMLDVLSDDLLSGGLLAADFLLAAAVVVAVVVTLEIHVFVLLFRRDRLSVFLTHGWEARRRLAEKNECSARRWESGGKARQVPNTHHRLARSRAPNGRGRPVQRTVRSCAGPSTRGREVGLSRQPDVGLVALQSRPLCTSSVLANDT